MYIQKTIGDRFVNKRSITCYGCPIIYIICVGLP